VELETTDGPGDEPDKDQMKQLMEKQVRMATVIDTFINILP
jgi:hypothetical protein